MESGERKRRHGFLEGEHDKEELSNAISGKSKTEDNGYDDHRSRKRPSNDESKVGCGLKDTAAIMSALDDSPPETVRNDYIGWKLPRIKKGGGVEHAGLDFLSSSSVNEEDFFGKYVSQRRPCVFGSLPRLSSSQPPEETKGSGNTRNDKQQGLDVKHERMMEITRRDLEKAVGTQFVQVEKRNNTRETFGQERCSQRQVRMTIRQLLKSIVDDKDELLYLSTQSAPEEEEDDDDDSCPNFSAFQTPCRQLVQQGILPPSLHVAGNLILHSCNLWMGRSSASSSGLHHDYHDNFYLLLRGRKRFRLYSPDCAPCMYLRGTLTQIHHNGLLSYRHYETRPDGVPLQMDDEMSRDAEEDEESVVLGKGFEYESEDDDEGGGGKFPNEDGEDDYEKFVEQTDGEHDVSSPRNNFSLVDPNLDSSDIIKEFPLFAQTQECTVELKAGQMLYLPAGWFHEVTSFGDGSKGTVEKDVHEHSAKDNYDGLEGCHVAINYWYHPPDDLQHFARPYKHDDLARMSRSSG